VAEIQTAGGQSREQTITRGLVFTGALMKPKDRFAPHFIDAQRSHQVLLFSPGFRLSPYRKMTSRRDALKVMHSFKLRTEARIREVV